MVGTWVLSLDLAIYLGVGISLVLFLRHARLLRVRELVLGEGGTLQERLLDAAPTSGRCPRIRILHVEGSLFFGAAGELQSALDEAARPSDVAVLIVRLKRAQGLDFTSAGVLEATAASMTARGQHLLLVGMTPAMMTVLERSGVANAIGGDNLFPTRERWFSALDAARARAVSLCGRDCETCPLAHVRFAATADRASLDAIPDVSGRWTTTKRVETRARGTTTSSNAVPPSASVNRPARFEIAPVKARGGDRTAPTPPARGSGWRT